MTLKITSIKNVENFLKVVRDECEESVYLVTDQGDCLNLKSTSTQYVALANIFDMPKSDIGTFSVKASDKDILKIMCFLVGE